MIPIAVQCCELCKVEKGSKGNSLIVLTAFSMAILPGSGWMSGVLWGPIISGMINSVPGTENLVNFENWFSVLFVPIMITTVLLLIGSMFALKPGSKLSADSIDEIKREAPKKLGRSEIIAGVVLASVFILFITNKLHDFSDAAVFVLFISGVLEAKDFNTGVNVDGFGYGGRAF